MRREGLKRLGRLLLCGGLLLAALAGCKSSRQLKTVDATGVKAHNEFFRAMEESSLHFLTMTARLNVDLEASGETLSSRVDLKMVKDSAFQLSVQPLLGIEIFRIELTRDTIKVLDRMNKRYMVENYEKLRGQTPIEFNFYNLQALFTNHLFIPGEREVDRKHYSRFKLRQEGPRAEIRATDAMGLIYTFLADGEEKLLSTHVVDESDRYALNWDYADFRLVEGQPFPMAMDARVMRDGRSVGGLRLYYSRVQLDQPVAMEFSIPAKYERVTFERVVRSIVNLNK